MPKEQLRNLTHTRYPRSPVLLQGRGMHSNPQLLTQKRYCDGELEPQSTHWSQMIPTSCKDCLKALKAYIFQQNKYDNGQKAIRILFVRKKKGGVWFCKALALKEILKVISQQKNLVLLGNSLPSYALKDLFLTKVTLVTSFSYS